MDAKIENSPLERRVVVDNPILEKRSSDEDYSSLSSKVQQRDRKQSWTVPELLNAQFTDPNWLVPGIIPIGLTILGGRPKIGKSFFAIDLAISKANGGVFLGRNLVAGKVLYLALEDRPRRIKERLIMLKAPEETQTRFDFEFPNLDQGGFNKLTDLIEENEVSLVVIDTLSRVFGRLDQDELGSMSETFGKLHDISLDLGIAILGLDHHRKPNGFSHDPVDDILGSTGKSAPLDTVLGLYRDRGSRDAKLMIVGRDVDDQEYRLIWDSVKWVWRLADQMGEDDSRKHRILGAIKELNKLNQLATPTKISGLTGIDITNVSHVLTDLMDESKVGKGSKIGVEQPYLIADNQLSGMSEQ